MYPVNGHTSWTWGYLIVLTVWLVSGRAATVASSEPTTTPPTPTTPTASSANHNGRLAPSANGIGPGVRPTYGNERLILDTAVLDTNQDGCISGEAELEAFKQQVARALSGMPSSLLRAHSIVHRTDVNRDGRICWCDFISIYLHDKALGNHHSVPYLVLPDTVMFSQLDRDHDGQLSGTERDQLQKEFESCLIPPKAKLIVTTMAELIDKDQSISREEYQEFFKIPHHPSHQGTPKEDNSDIDTHSP